MTTATTIPKLERVELATQPDTIHLVAGRGITSDTIAVRLWCGRVSPVAAATLLPDTTRSNCYRCVDNFTDPGPITKGHPTA